MKVAPLITPSFRALLALAFTGWVVALRFHLIKWIRPQSSTWASTWLFSGILPAWAMVTINAAFYACLVFAIVILAVSPIRKEEKTLWVTCFASILLGQVPLLLPKVSGVVGVVQTALCSAAFLAAVALLVSLWQERADKGREQE